MNSIWGGVTTVFSFFTQVAETYDKLIPDELPIGWERGARWRDGTRAFRKIGHCPLALAIDFCHRHNIEIFLTYRMNDIHDGSAGEPYEFSNWKRDHSQYLLGTQEEADRYPFSHPRHFWSALNYEQPEVRNYIFKIMEDFCQRYDLDGLELDWLRISTFFQPTRDLRPVEPKHIAIMNDFVRRIRTMTDRVGRERGRPLLISCRVPRTLKHSLDVGLDIRTWLKEDLVDVLVLGGGYAPMDMAREMRAIADLTHQYDVPRYGCISNRELGC